MRWSCIRIRWSSPGSTDVVQWVFIAYEGRLLTVDIMEAILEGIKIHVAQGHARVVIVFFALESSKPDLSYIWTGDYGFLQLRQVFKAVSFSWVRRHKFSNFL